MKRGYTFYFVYDGDEKINLVVETQLSGQDQDGFLDISLKKIECITDEESGEELDFEVLDQDKILDLIEEEIEKHYKKLTRLFDENN